MTKAARGFLDASARHGSILLTVGIFAGLLIPPLAHAMAWFITPNVVLLVTLVLLRVDIPATFAHLTRPLVLALIVAVILVAAPVVTAALVRLLPLDPGIAAGAVIFATGSVAVSGPAFARLVGLDPDLTLLTTLVVIFLVPLTGPPLSHALTGVDLAISVGGFMARLAVVVGIPLLVSLGLRRWIDAARLAPYGQAVDGAVVWLVVFYGFAVMDGLLARLLSDPLWVAQATGVAFAADFGLNVLTTLALLWLGLRPAASAGLMAGNRNMALYLAVLPAATDPRITLFFAICQFPLFLSPFLLGAAYRKIIRK